MTWHQEANCLGVDAEVFFPTRGDTAGFLAAVAICQGCPVTEQCLEENLDERDGVYAGLSGAQRRKLRSERGVNRTCLHCSTGFRAHHPQQGFCSDACKKARHHEQKIESATRAWWTE